MPVSKRTRFEVLRRDNHTCRYCGASAPDAKITVDHVTPVALGGSDDPSNLVTACRDCNAGKSSSAPDAALVADVEQADLRWSAALVRVAEARSAERERREDYVATFVLAWGQWRYGYENERFPLPSNWKSSLERFYEIGVPIGDIEHCVAVACGNERIALDEVFRYFAGCVWRVVTEMQGAAKQLLDAEDAG